MKKESLHSHQLADHFFRHNYAKMLAVLIRYFGLGQVEIAEDLVQDTLVEAMEKWSIQGIPNNPGGWLMDVAKKKAINYLKRDHSYRTKILPKLEIEAPIDSNKGEDSTLRMIFACCHPSLPVESQIALALKSLCGLSIPEIANALLTSDANINKRLYRAKQKFRKGLIVFEIPKSIELSERLDSVCSTLYLLFNEGYYSLHDEKAIRMDLCFEAIRLLKQIIKAFPDSAKAKALLALMLLLVARFESRLDANGALVLLADQDRSLWDQQLMAEGLMYLHQSIQYDKVNKYQLQAGIAAEHGLAPSFATTNWESIYRQYRLLMQLEENVLVQFNGCIAQFYAGHQLEALAAMLDLANEDQLQLNPHFYITLGVFHYTLGQKEKAIPNFEIALRLSKSVKEKMLIQRKIEA